MMIKRLIPQLLLSLICTQSIIAEELKYSVEFRGELSPLVKSTLYSVSQLHLLQNQPPMSPIALRRRAEADLPNLINGLHSLAYYNATVDLQIDYEEDPIKVILLVDPGAVYPLASFDINFLEESDSLFWITPADLGLKIGKAATPKSILDAESDLLLILAQEGFPLAEITRRRVVADQQEKVIRVELEVDPGGKVVFGPVRFIGLERVKPRFAYSKLTWNRGDPFDPDLIYRTQYELEATGLFSAISVQQGEKVVLGNQLPISIFLKEAQHRTIGAGISYSTYLGPGILFQWENRNMQGRGRKLGFKCEITANKQSGEIDYVVPHFIQKCQQLTWSVDVDKERTTGFSESYVSVSGIVDRQMADRLRLSYGFTFKDLYSSRSDNNRVFNLLKSPLHLRWNGADSILSPTYGGTIHFKTIPTAEIITDRYGYVINQLTGTSYWPLFGDDSLVLAFKGTIGSIFGSARKDIPPPERFYAGSENTLRGYKYMTVSPLGPEGKPIGGRSIMVYSIESRFKLKKNLGWAFFYEIGNVYRKEFPQFDHKQLQSFGCGVRYCTPVGPLRADIAFPLNRRPDIDRGFQFYISVGEAF